MTAKDDERLNRFARFMQARDARIFEVQGTDGNFQKWEDIGEMGQEEYVKDAGAYLAAVDTIDRVLAAEENAWIDDELSGQS